MCNNGFACSHLVNTPLINVNAAISKTASHWNRPSESISIKAHPKGMMPPSYFSHCENVRKFVQFVLGFILAAVNTVINQRRPSDGEGLRPIHLQSSTCQWYSIAARTINSMAKFSLAAIQIKSGDHGLWVLDPCLWRKAQFIVFVDQWKIHGQTRRIVSVKHSNVCLLFFPVRDTYSRHSWSANNKGVISTHCPPFQTHQSLRFIQITKLLLCPNFQRAY